MSALTLEDRRLLRSIVSERAALQRGQLRRSRDCTGRRAWGEALRMTEALLARLDATFPEAKP